MHVLESFVAYQTVLVLIPLVPILSILPSTINKNASDTPDVRRWRHIYSTPTLLVTRAAFFRTWNNLSFCFSFSLSISGFVWFFNRKQRQQPLGGGRWRKTTSLPCFQLSTNVLYFSSLNLNWLDIQLVAVLLMSGYYCCPLLAQGKYVSASLYLLCSAVAKNDLCLPKSLTLGSQEISFTMKSNVLAIGQPWPFFSMEGRSLSVAGNHWVEKENNFDSQGQRD